MRAATRKRIATAVVAVLVAAPIWLARVLPTTDGPSHLYNVMIGQALRAGNEVYGAVFRVAGGLRPNMATWEILGLLGPLVGWSVAERILATTAALATFGAAVHLFDRFGDEEQVLLHVPAAGWFASGWFLWMGFYDFSLSLALLFLLPAVLEQEPGVRREASVYLLMAGLYLTHLFSFALAAGVCLFEPLWRGLGRRGHRSAESTGSTVFVVRLPLAALLLVQLFVVGGLRSGASLVQDFEPFRSLAGVFLGDYLIGFSRLDLVGSLPLTVLILVWVLHTARRALAGEVRLADLRWLEATGLALLVASLFLPDVIAEGEYVLTRLRVVGAAFLTAGAARGVWRERPGVTRAAGAVLLAGLILHGGTVVRAGDAVARDSHDAARLASELGARRGDWTQSPVVEWDDGFFRVDPYSHLDDRVNLEHGYLAAEDYEAARGAFPIRYTLAPNRLADIDWPDERDVELLSGQGPWPDTLYLLLPTDFSPGRIGPGVEWGPVRRGERVAVARVTLRRRDAPP